jgi:hypothetical protein
MNEETVAMSSPRRRLAIVAFIALFQIQALSYGKAPKKTETEGLVYATFPNQPKPASEVLGYLVRQARWDDGQLGVGNEQRLKLRFVKADDQVTPKGAATRYRVFADGASENKVYGWSVWQPGELPKVATGDIYVNARGLLMTHRPQPAEEMSSQIAEGEFDITPEAGSAMPLRYEISSRDNTFSMPGTLVPHPVASFDQGCRLEVRIAQPNAEAVLFVADTFPPEIKIPLVLESEGQSATLTLETDIAGHAIVAAFPFVSGKTHGLLKATVEGPSCLPSVTLPWGSEGRSSPKAP